MMLAGMMTCSRRSVQVRLPERRRLFPLQASAVHVHADIRRTYISRFPGNGKSFSPPRKIFRTEKSGQPFRDRPSGTRDGKLSSRLRRPPPQDLFSLWTFQRTEPLRVLPCTFRPLPYVLRKGRQSTRKRSQHVSAPTEEHGDVWNSRQTPEEPLTQFRPGDKTAFSPLP